MLVELSNCCTKLREMKARIAERSMPPIGGIMPLNAFKYGSVIELIEVRIGLLQSMLGNQLSNTLIISTNE